MPGIYLLCLLIPPESWTDMLISILLENKVLAQILNCQVRSNRKNAFQQEFYNRESSLDGDSAIKPLLKSIAQFCCTWLDNSRVQNILCLPEILTEKDIPSPISPSEQKVLRWNPMYLGCSVRQAANSATWIWTVSQFAALQRIFPVMWSVWWVLSPVLLAGRLRTVMWRI